MFFFIIIKRDIYRLLYTDSGWWYMNNWHIVVTTRPECVSILCRRVIVMRTSKIHNRTTFNSFKYTSKHTKYLHTWNKTHYRRHYYYYHKVDSSYNPHKYMPLHLHTMCPHRSQFWICGHSVLLLDNCNRWTFMFVAIDLSLYLKPIGDS